MDLKVLFYLFIVTNNVKFVCTFKEANLTVRTLCNSKLYQDISCPESTSVIAVINVTIGFKSDLPSGEVCAVNNTAHLTSESQDKTMLDRYVDVCTNKNMCRFVERVAERAGPDSYISIYFECHDQNESAVMCQSNMVTDHQVLINNYQVTQKFTACNCVISLTGTTIDKQLLLYTYDARIGNKQVNQSFPLTLYGVGGFNFTTWTPYKSHTFNLPASTMNLMFNNTELKEYKFWIKIRARDPASQVTVQCTDGENTTTTFQSTTASTTLLTNPTTSISKASSKKTSTVAAISTLNPLATSYKPTARYTTIDSGSSIIISSIPSSSDKATSPTAKTAASTSETDKGGTVIGLIVGIVAILVIVVCCICYKKQCYIKKQVHPDKPKSEKPAANNSTNLQEKGQELIEEIGTKNPPSAVGFPYLPSDLQPLTAVHPSPNAMSSSSNENKLPQQQQDNEPIKSNDVNKTQNSEFLPSLFPPVSSSITPNRNTSDIDNIFGPETNTEEQRNNDDDLGNENSEIPKKEKKKKKKKKKNRKHTGAIGDLDADLKELGLN